MDLFSPGGSATPARRYETETGTDLSADVGQWSLRGGRTAASVSVRVGDGQALVVLRGEVDLDIGDDLLEAATDALAQGAPVSVDASAVTFMDSTGVAFLARLASRAPGRVRLLDPPDLVRFLVGVTSVAPMIDIVGGGDDSPS